MCGLAGYLSRSSNNSGDPQSVLRAMASKLEHRGPDAEGLWFDLAAGFGVSHRRLSIQDLSPLGNQPMLSRDGRWVMAFNGEIYNFLELRRDLEATGVSLRGGSDTEVLVELVSMYGLSEALSKCNGMFAVAVWDRREQSLHLARDRFGEKPLYYGRCGTEILFASELSAMRAHPSWDRSISRSALALYLKYNYVPAPYSIYEGVSKVKPGQIVTFSAKRFDHKVESTYWDATERFEAIQAQPMVFSLEDATDQLDAMLRHVIQRQMIADVPLGAFLSGGIDSSLVVAIMQQMSSQPVRTFTIGFAEKEFNEAPYARCIADHLGTMHTEVVISPTEAREVIPRLSRIYSEPFADASQIPTYLVSKVTKQDVTVALSGDGGDELFAGYTRYRWALSRWRKLNRGPQPLRRIVGQLLSHLPHSLSGAEREASSLAANMLGRSYVSTYMDRLRTLGARWTDTSFAEAYLRDVIFWPESEEVVRQSSDLPSLDTYIGKMELAALDPVKWMMFRDSRTYLPDDILCKVDRATMSVSLESRIPFLDHEIAELAWSIDSSVHLSDGQGKRVLRSLLDRFIPPHMFDRKKTGFAIPLRSWLRGPLRPWAEELLSPARIARDGWFDAKPIRRRWRALLQGASGHEFAIWGVLMFQSWLDDQDADRC